MDLKDVSNLILIQEFLQIQKEHFTILDQSNHVLLSQILEEKQQKNSDNLCNQLLKTS